MPRTRRPYPSGLSDQEWVLLEPLLASSERRGRPPKWPARRVADAVFYLPRNGCAWRMLPRAHKAPERGDNVLRQSLKPLAAEIWDPTLDFRKRRRSHSTFYAVLNVHPRVAQMSVGHGSFSTTIKYYTGVLAGPQNRRPRPWASCSSRARTERMRTLLPSRSRQMRRNWPRSKRSCD